MWRREIIFETPHMAKSSLNIEIESTMDAIGENVNDCAGSYYGTVDRYRDTGCQQKKEQK